MAKHESHHGAARARHFEMTEKHEERDGGMGRHPKDMSNKSHMHNAVRHLTNESMLSERPIESHLPHYHPDKPGV